MDDGTALLAAIRLHPDEDVPRLAYADWLDENGQPERAEFVRLQCEIARITSSLRTFLEYDATPPVRAVSWRAGGELRGDPKQIEFEYIGEAPEVVKGEIVDWEARSNGSDVRGVGVVMGRLCEPTFRMGGLARNTITLEATGDYQFPHADRKRVAELTAREAELIRDSGPWGLPMPFKAGVGLRGNHRDPDDQCNYWRWSRGFVEHVRCPAADWLAHADAILAAHPVQEVTLATPTWWVRRADGVLSICEQGQSQGRACRSGVKMNSDIINFDRGIVGLEHVFRAEWPTVKTWHLSAEPTFAYEDIMRMWRRLHTDVLITPELLRDSTLNYSERFVENQALVDMIDQASWRSMVNAAPLLISPSAFARPDIE